MSNIDFDQVIIPAQKAVEAAAARSAAIKADCTFRIATCLDLHTVMNLHGAALAETLDADQRACFAAAQGWIQAMQTACRVAISNGADPVWPVLPDGVEALAAEF
ncbi:hypothetical protein [Tateyamaria sp. SN6-1]|uniref:hypothetical protein n=1 Tax=Tateyamaria sp. SN6-1 TaxID=3092148 RepID=UPI0039F478E7